MGPRHDLAAVGYVVWFLLCIVVIIPYLIILLRRGSVEAMLPNWGLDRVSFLATIFGGAALGQLLGGEFSLRSSSLSMVVLTVIPFLLVAALLFILPRKTRAVAMTQEARTDERVAAISAKSSRNELTVTYLALAVFLWIDGGALDRNSVVILLGSGLMAFYVSYLFYFYAKSWT